MAMPKGIARRVMLWQPSTRPSALTVMFILTVAGAVRISQMPSSKNQVDSTTVFNPLILQEQWKYFKEQMKVDPNLQRQLEAAMLDPAVQDPAQLVKECPACMQMEALDGQEQTDATEASSSLIGLSLSPWAKVAALLLMMNPTSGFIPGPAFKAPVPGARSPENLAVEQALAQNMPRSIGGRGPQDKLSMTALDAEVVEASTLDPSDVVVETDGPVDTAMSSPGMTENTKFVCDYSVDLWRDFQREGPVPTSRDNARAIVDIVAKYTVPGRPDYSLASAAHWAKHLGRTSYFIANALTGTLAQQYFGQAGDSSFQAFGDRATGDKAPSNGLANIGVTGASATRLVLEAIMVYEQDWKRIVSKDIRPPWDMERGHRQSTLPYALRQTALFVPEAIGTLSRRDRGTPEDRKIWFDAAPELYPDYYKNPYHYQTDGWMSSRSADVYETSTETLFLGRQDAMQRLSLLPLKSLKGQDGKPPKILEVASGTGRFATFLRDNHPSAELTQVDLSPFYLQKARENDEYWRTRRQKADPPARFVQANAEALPFEDGAFDAVVCVYLFHEMPKEARAAAAAEMARVLAPGGTLVLTDSVQRGDRPSLDAALPNFEKFNEPHYNNYLATDIGSLFVAHGLLSREKFMASTTKTLSFERPASPETTASQDTASQDTASDDTASQSATGTRPVEWNLP